MAFHIKDATVLSLLDREYDIRGLVGVSQLPGSVMNPNWTLESVNSRRHVVRCFLRNRDPARLVFQMAFHRSLAEMGFPVPRIVVNRRGESLTLHAGLSWAVYAWVDGDDYDYNSPGQLDAAGRLLGNLHTRLEQVEIPGYVEPAGFPPYPLWAGCGEALIRGSLRCVKAFDLPPEDIDFALDVQRWMAETLGAVDYGALRKQFVWGDFHGRNLKFRGERIVGLFDFDVVRWESPAYDVGSGVFMFCRRSRTDPTLRPDAVTRLIRSYTRNRALSAPEARAILPLLIYRYITDLALPDPLPPGSDAFAEARKAIRILRAVWEAREPLGELLAAESG